MGVLVQVISTLIICFSCLNVGIVIVWPSSTILLFMSENTTLHRPMRDLEISLYCSLMPFRSLVTLPLLVYVIDRLGRKHTLTLTAWLIVLAWAIIALSKRVDAILVASMIVGCGISAILTASIYIAEIAQDSVRGTLSCGPILFCNIGILISYFLGGYIEYQMMVYTCLSLAVIGVLMTAVLKESPVTLLLKGREEEAAKSIAFYRSIESTSKEVMTELNHIRLATIFSHSEDASILLVDGKKEIKPLRTEKISSWQTFKTSPPARRQFYLGMVLNTSFICHGLPILQTFAEPVFAIAVGDEISPNLCSIILGVVVVIAGILAAYLIETVGRRPLQLHSSIVSGVCCTVVGIQIATELLPKWTVPLFICIYAGSFTVGSGTVSFVVTAEIFLPEVKSVFLTILTAWSAICSCIVFFPFNMILPYTGLAPMFFFFSFTCFSTSIYFFYFLPEIKGLSLYAIQSLFTKNVQIGCL